MCLVSGSVEGDDHIQDIRKVRTKPSKTWPVDDSSFTVVDSFPNPYFCNVVCSSGVSNQMLQGWIPSLDNVIQSTAMEI